VRISTLSDRNAGETELGVVFASTEGVDDPAFDRCLAMLCERAEAIGATALLGLQVVQSQFQWNARTSLLATAYGSADGLQGERQT
jgi:phytoene/squalene synthetase